MPNHVHMLATPSVPLPKLTKSLKGITAKRANTMLTLTGKPFWQRAMITWCGASRNLTGRATGGRPRPRGPPRGPPHSSISLCKYAVRHPFWRPIHLFVLRYYRIILVRVLTSVLAKLALLLAFMQATSLHVHSHEITERHVGGFFHTHLEHAGSHSGSVPEWRDFDPDDDAQALNWTPANPSDSELAPVILAASYITTPTLGLTARRNIAFRPSAHDPPALDATSPRAPPTV